MATDKHLAIVDQICLHREDAKRAAFRLAMAMAERVSHAAYDATFELVKNDRAMTYADPGVMFGAPLVLHGQDRDEKFPFYWVGFFSR
jgi:hypothetical protein